MIGFNSCLSANHISTEVKLNNSTRGEKAGKKKQHQGEPMVIVSI